MQTAVLLIIGLLGVVFHAGWVGHAHAQSSYYQGKTIKLIQGREPGGSGDIRSRAVIPFLRKYIPGNPNIVSEFMPGGGGRKAANYIFNTARPDGLTIGHVSSGIVTSAVLGEPGIQYDLDKFHWLGSTDSAFHYAFFIRKELALSNLEKLRAYSGLRSCLKRLTQSRKGRKGDGEYPISLAALRLCVRFSWLFRHSLRVRCQNPLTVLLGFAVRWSLNDRQLLVSNGASFRS